MADRPILFSAPMVRALLDGTKTQTRRAPRHQFAPDAVPTEMPKIAPEGWVVGGHSGVWWCDAAANPDDAIRCPYGVPGDRLWVRETCRGEELPDGLDGVRYMADSAFRPIENTTAASIAWLTLHTYRGKKTATVPSIHMPRWASRILLEVTEVRAERLQDISRGDAMAEGCPFPNMAKGDDPRQWYRNLWDQINGAGVWDANPWVWAITFKRITP